MRQDPPGTPLLWQYVARSCFAPFPGDKHRLLARPRMHAHITNHFKRRRVRASIQLAQYIIGNTAGASGLAGTDLQNATGNLGSLQDNGGPTLTCALLQGSLAIGAGKARTRAGNQPNLRAPAGPLPPEDARCD